MIVRFKKTTQELIEELREVTGFDKEQFDTLRDNVFIAYMVTAARGARIYVIDNAQIILNEGDTLAYIKKSSPIQVSEWHMPRGTIKFQPEAASPTG